MKVAILAGGFGNMEIVGPPMNVMYHRRPGIFIFLQTLFHSLEYSGSC